MSRYARRSVVMLVIAALGFAGGLGTAVASVSGPAPSVDTRFVGTYRIHTTIDGTDDHFTGTLVVHDDGTATDRHGSNLSHWTSNRRHFTMTLQQPTSVTVYWGKLSATGIGTRKDPGTWYSESGFGGTWYAVRVL
ncbi:MAG: hypothetical protein QOH10_1090 [Actinomycetota bacterium]|jgi:hypothetical protein|nr:hypothetical protein [Actinomycetota bacterium]